MPGIKIEKQLEDIAEAVVQSKEAATVEIKSVKDTITELQDELANIKSGASNMPVENKVNELAEAKKAFFKMAATGLDSKGQVVEDTLIDKKGITTEAGSAGESIVEELAGAILIPAQEAYTILGDMGTLNVSSPEYSKVVLATHAGATWGSENVTNVAPGQTATPTFVKISAKFATVRADNFITTRALKDPKYNLESVLVQDTKTQIGRVMSQGVIDGDGQGDNPKGILAHFETVESAKADDVRSKDVFGEITAPVGMAADDEALISLLKDLENELATPYQSGAVFYVNKAIFKRLSLMKDGNKVSYLQPDLSGKSSGFLFGYPVKVEVHLQDDQTIGNRPVLFGNLSVGFEKINSDQFEFLRNPYIVPGNINFHWELYVGTMMGDSNAVKAIAIVA